jgi:hypothetical protein
MNMARFKPGQSGNPAGRRPGNVTQYKLRAALGEDLEQIIAVIRERAMAGDMGAVRLILDRTIGPIRATDPPVTLPLTGNPGEDARTIAQAAGAGDISPGTAQQLMGAIASQARVLEMAELLHRIERLEEKANGVSTTASR